MQSTCCIDEDDIIAVFRCVFQRFLGNFHGTEFVPHFKYGNVVVFPNYLQLFDRRRTIYVAGYQQRISALLSQLSRQLPAAGGFTGTLQTYHHVNGGRTLCKSQLTLRGAHESDKLFIYNLNHLLSRIQTFQHLCANSPFRNSLDEVFNDFKVYVCLQKRNLYFPHGGFYICFCQLAFAPQLLEHILQLIGKVFKCHRPPSSQDNIASAICFIFSSWRILFSERPSVSISCKISSISRTDFFCAWNLATSPSFCS